MASEKSTSKVLDLIEGELAEQTGTCKFVVIGYDSENHLVFGPVREYPYHANLVEVFCSQNELAGSWERKPDMFNVFEEDVMLRGGGYLVVQSKTRKVEFSGRSTAYGAFRAADVKAIVTGSPLFADFRVVIRG